MNLFIQQNIKLHSGATSDFKIECDALTDADLKRLAYLVSKKFPFKKVIGIGKIFSAGRRFATELNEYLNDKAQLVLIADDVLTTSKSMEETRQEGIKYGIEANSIRGVVIFSRGICPTWITPIFQMSLIF